MTALFDRSLGAVAPALVGTARRGVRRVPVAVRIVVAGAIALALAGCDALERFTGGTAARSPSAATEPAQGAPGKPAPDPMLVTVNPELLKRLLIGPVESQPTADVLRVAGRIEPNAYKTTRVGAPITGRVQQVDALLGQQVRAGAVLAEISSTELAQAQLAFLRAHSEKQLLTRAVERAQQLLAADVIGAAELQRRESELAVATAEKRAARDQLRALGLSPARIQRLEDSGQIEQSTAISATLGGTVIERSIAQGQMVQPSDVLFVISDLDHLWGVAEMPEQDTPFVRVGQRVQVEVPALDNARFTGRVAYVADVVNPETRTVRVGVELPNKERRLKPSMLMTMLIEGRPVERQLVPVSAVVREADRDHVFVESGTGQFRMVHVRLGPAKDGVRPLIDALPPDTRVVLDGAFHLNNVREQRAVAGG